MTTQHVHRWVTVCTVLAVGYLLTRDPLPAGKEAPPLDGLPAAPRLSSPRFLSTQKARQLGAFYFQFAEIVERDAGIVSTLSQFRSAHKRALRLAYAGTETSEGEQVGADIDSILSASIGDDLSDRKIDSELRARIVAGLREVSRLCQRRHDDGE